MTFMPVALWLLAINGWSFIMFGRDKGLAVEGRRRIAESTLLSLALFGGSLGALAGRRYFRHKTRKEPFRTYLFLICLAQLAGLLLWLLSGVDADPTARLGLA